MLKKKTTDSKKYSVIGWVVYFGSGVLGILNYVDLALVGFMVSYIILFLLSVYYEKEQLDKGLMMIMIGACFVVLLSAITGLDLNNSQLFKVSESMKMPFTALVAIAGATFFGAGGSMIANVAAANSTDAPSTPLPMKCENKLSLNNVEDRLEKNNRLLWGVIILMTMVLIVLAALIIVVLI